MYHQLTLSHGAGGGAPLRAHTVHGLLPCGGHCCRLSHLILLVGLNFRGDLPLSRLALRWLINRSGKWLSIIGGLGLVLRTAGRWWAGLWVWSGSGEIINGRDGERRSVSCQNPLHEGGEILSKTIFGRQRSARGVQACIIECAERFVRVAGGVS